MKLNKLLLASISSICIFMYSIPTYAISTNIITANNVDNISLDGLSIISSNNGEVITNIGELNSVFSIVFANEDYITTKFATVVDRINNNISIPVYTSPYEISVEIGKIPVGSTVVIEKEENGFSQIFFDEQIGYIKSEYLASSKIIEEDIISEIYIEPSKIQDYSNLSVTAQAVVEFAKLYLGKPYIYGGTNLSIGTDCSGFTYSVFNNFGIELNRISKDQYLNGVDVSKEELLPGDLVFFNTGGDSEISHVGIYIGDDQYIHSTDTDNIGVIISSMTSEYSLNTYYGAKRVIDI